MWGLKVVEEKLYLGHHDGSFLWDDQNERITAIRRTQGTWGFLELKKYPNYVVAGTYQGIDLYQKSDQGLVFVRRLTGLDESCRFLVEDDEGFLWMSHPYRGIFKITLSPNLDS